MENLLKYQIVKKGKVIGLCLFGKLNDKEIKEIFRQHQEIYEKQKKQK